MAKQNPNITYQWCFLEIFVGNYYVSQGFNFSSPIYFQLYHVVLLFYKGICFIMHHNIVTLITIMQQITISEKGPVLEPYFGSIFFYFFLNFKDENSLKK